MAHNNPILSKLDASASLQPNAAAEDVPTEAGELPVCVSATLLALTDEHVQLKIAGRNVTASCDPSVHPSVLAGALARGERVLAERHDGAWLVIGALHTQPIPGIDKAESYTIEADTIRLEAAQEVSLAAQTASLVVRAVGEVETYAERILSRAEGLHKIVGRMLRLN